MKRSRGIGREKDRWVVWVKSQWEMDDKYVGKQKHIGTIDIHPKLKQPINILLFPSKYAPGPKFTDCGLLASAVLPIPS